MPRLILTAGAVSGLERCRQFLAAKAPAAAEHAAAAIARQFQLLGQTPERGRPFPELPELRELIIPFGDCGYVALYRPAPGEGAVYLLAFRHQKEAG